MHLPECVLQFGPVHTHWTFPWERMNGCMGSIPMNRHHVEQQFMRHFVRQQVLRELPSLTDDVMEPAQQMVFDSLWGEVKSLPRALGADMLIAARDLGRSSNLVNGSEPIDFQMIHLHNKKKYHTFPPVEQKHGNDYPDLIKSVSQLFPHLHAATQIQVDPFHERATSMRLFGDRIGTDLSRLKRSSYVLVYFKKRVMPVQCLSFVTVQITEHSRQK